MKRDRGVVLIVEDNHAEQLLIKTIFEEFGAGNDVYVVDGTIDVHIRKIREKLEQHSDLIETVKGVGYRFKSVE